MRWTAPPLPVSITIVLVGAVVLLATGIAMLQLSGRFHADAQRMTVPDAIDLEVEPNATIIIQRELAGPHITANRPLEPLPSGVEITVTDAQTGTPIQTEPNTWWTRQRFFGLERHRRGIVAFTAPAHGRVRIDVRGDFIHDQVFAVAPSFQTFSNRYAVPLSASAGVGALLVVLGLAACVVRVGRLPDPSVGMPDAE